MILLTLSERQPINYIRQFGFYRIYCPRRQVSKTTVTSRNASIYRSVKTEDRKSWIAKYCVENLRNNQSIPPIAERVCCRNATAIQSVSNFKSKRATKHGFVQYITPIGFGHWYKIGTGRTACLVSGKDYLNKTYDNKLICSIFAIREMSAYFLGMRWCKISTPLGPYPSMG